MSQDEGTTMLWKGPAPAPVPVKYEELIVPGYENYSFINTFTAVNMDMLAMNNFLSKR